MVASRKRPKGVRSYYGPFGLSVLVMSLMPRQIGYQDMVALMARQPEATQRVRASVLASPFGTIHAATFSFPRPIGTMIPEPPPYQLAGLATGDLDTTGAIGGERGLAMVRPRLDFPLINRRLKGDLLVTRPREEPLPDEGTRDMTPGRVKTVSFPKPAEASPPDTRPVPGAFASPEPKPAPKPAAVIDAVPPPAPLALAPAETAPDFEAEVVTAALSPKAKPAPKVAAQPAPKPGDKAAPARYQLAALPPPSAREESPLFDPVDDTNPAVRLGRLYFGNNPVGEAVGPIQPWPMDEELLIQGPPANDPDIKRSALTPPAASEYDRGDRPALLPQPSAPDAKAPPIENQTVAPKGEVTGPGKRPKTPAERLGLDAKSRAKSEKCLTEAVYFESRGESKRGQIAVAQVVMNRVFSGFYPTNVCGVVYQNAHRKLACQFTFACDNVPDVVNEPAMWQQAKDIARDMLDGKLWLSEVGHSTHYHAYWVHPGWVREMQRMHKIGVHSFYRPRRWGDGSEMPVLGQPQVDEAAAKAKL
jgi:spore germination cell wall hydrolase CwlJ-like protein